MVAERRDDGYESAQHIARSHECPDCRHKSRLAVRFIPTTMQHEVICHRCKRTTGFVRRKGLTQIWRENPEALPVEVANKMAAKHRGEIEAVAEGLPPELGEIVRRKYGV